MQWLTPWTVVGTVLCVLVLAVLFFPFVFKIDFEAGLKGLVARLFIFKKQLYKYEKKFPKDEDESASLDTDDFDKRPDDDDAVVPTYVPPKKKVEPATEPVAESIAPAPKPVKENQESPKAESTSTSEPVQVPVIKSENQIPEKKESQELKADFIEKEENAKASGAAEKPKTESIEKPQAAEKKKEKRSLTDTEFWTIILSPDIDAVGFWAVKKWLLCLLRLFHVRFKDCFVEGIRSDMMSMGYGAALNGIIKGFPYICDWDIRMDWTRDHELRAAGQIFASVNVCRILGLLIATLFYGGIIAFKFWRRRTHVLKTNELPELDWIRTKIVKFMAEE